MSHPALIVHGGAGRYADAGRDGAVAGCEAAARRGWAVLRGGGSALDAVQTAVMVLEDDPRFNAGTGSVLNVRGAVEMDASIMDGARLAAGAVGAVSRVRNPVRLARLILDEGTSVFRVGPAAEAFAGTRGLEMVDPRTLISTHQRNRWHAAHETVGCVALDARGHLAAATSTGGLFDKPEGRVGDSALIGCGTYADDRGAVSCTGNGEAIIRAGLALRVLSALTPGTTPQVAAEQALNWLARRIGAEAGLILLEPGAGCAVAHNAPGMAFCRIEGPGEGSMSSGL